jgi:hypothetical protein
MGFFAVCRKLEGFAAVFLRRKVDLKSMYDADFLSGGE